MKKKKIFYVVESFGGGVFSYLQLLSNKLSGKYEIYILYGIRSQTPDNVQKFFDESIHLIPIESFCREINIKKDFKSFSFLKKYINEVNPDIVHLHSSKAGVIGRIIKIFHFIKYKNIKFFYTPHGYSFLMENSSTIQKYIFYIIENVLGRFNTTTIACGKGEYNESKRLGSNTTYVNNCVDLSYIDSFKCDEKTDDVFYTVGRISAQKNPKLFNSIALQNPSKKFIWIGDGPMRSELTSNNIEILGWIPRDQVMSKVKCYPNFVLTSSWEGLPISLLEAMAMRKNCFVTNVIGNAEVINDDNGYKFNDVDDFNYVIRHFSDRSKEKGNAARHDIEKYYSEKEFIKKYTSIYEEKLLGDIK
ncbi:glycosyltransferase family 4 protein [Apilactobacillus apinorum]|uniref:glycosyltransferase n=1 Tax=Apilactobacillus apinorum TaxID=1218495 RepID=UPI0030E9A6EC